MKRIDQLSLGWRTDLIFPRFDAHVIERSDHWLIRTPHNPTYWWGNFLLYPRAPREGDAHAWLAAFDEEIASVQPQSRHIAIGVDAAAPFELPPDFAAAGLCACETTVLSLRAGRLRTTAKVLPAGLVARPLRLAAESPLAIEQQVASDDDGHEPVGYRVFRERQMQRYAAMELARLGHWFGVLARTPQGQAMTAGCGLFRDGTLGRFQYVSTHPAWRRRGLCTALVHAVCRHGFEAMGLDTLVIAADPDDVAIGIYESLGFERTASAWQLERRPADDHR
ncbi:GNAT family N-acetyltransferase [Piscinibacter sp. XHJ-5]|uniref:GNAT family N-acetyltransferase n=1 Tax=Piscinibacter sp. XHJ-5 TaxID=3037797 RepID=UPI002452AA32|nr:GNAT family N-acetyltransferase [Piscinibacter sp. XHJ-5]